MLKRRALLTSLPAVAIGTAGLSQSLLASAQVLSTDKINDNLFTHLVGHHFSIVIGHTLVKHVNLNKVVANNADLKLNQFSLYFNSTQASNSEAILNDENYHLYHSTLGLVPVFIQTGNTATEYCAHFSLLRT